MGGGWETPSASPTERARQPTMTSIPVSGLFAPGLELADDVRDQLEAAAEFLAGAAELFDITAQTAEIKRQELAEARSAAQLADEAPERSGRTVDLANGQMAALLCSAGLIRTADGLVRRRTGRAA